MKNRIFLILSICILFISCSFNLIEEKKDAASKGSLYISLPTKNEIRTVGEVQQDDTGLDFFITVANLKSGYLYEGTFKDGNKVLIENLKNGEYNIRVFATDGFNNYEGNEIKTIDFSSVVKDTPLEINIDVKCEAKNGQLNVCFDTIQLSNNSSFTVSVLDDTKKEIYKKVNIPSYALEDNQYVIPAFFLAGEYYVNITGGNEEREIYKVNNDNKLKVEINKVTDCLVKAQAVNTYYIKETSVNSESNGSAISPFKSIQEALLTVKDLNGPFKFIIDGTNNITTPLVFDDNKTYSISGINSGKIIATDIVAIENKSSNITLNDIEIASNSKADLLLTGGSLTIANNVSFDNFHITDSYLQNNIVRINSSINSPSITLTLDSFKQGNRIFSLPYSSTIDFSNITLSDPTYFISSNGVIDANKTVLHIAPPLGYTNMSYKVYKGADIVSQGQLFSYGVTLDTVEGNANRVTLIGYKDGLKYNWEKTITIQKNYNELAFLDNDAVCETGLVTLNGNSNISESEFPLKIVATDRNGQVYTQYVKVLPCNLVLPPETYDINIIPQSLDKVFTPISNVIVSLGSPLVKDITLKPNKVYYVSTSGTESGDGTKDNPYNSLSKLTSVLNSSTTPITIVVLSDITETTTFTCPKAVTVSIKGEGDVTPTISSDVKLITVDNNSHIILKNIKLCQTNFVSPFIEVKKGVLTLDYGSEITSTSSPAAIISVSDAQKIQLKDNANVVTSKAEIELATDSKIELLSDLTQNRIHISENFLHKWNNNQCIIVSGNSEYPNLVKNNYAKFSIYGNSNYWIYEDGTVATISNEKEIDKFAKNEALYLTLKLNISTENELKDIMKSIRKIPINKGKMITLEITPSGSFTSITKAAINPLGDQNSLVTNITLNDGITSIEADAFSDFISLENITLPSSLLHIKDRAFSNCQSLRSIELPLNLLDIGVSAFGGLLDNIKFNSAYNSIWMIEKNPNTVVSISNNNSDSSKNADFFKKNKQYSFKRLLTENDLGTVINTVKDFSKPFLVYTDDFTKSIKEVIPSSFSGILNIDTAASTKINNGFFASCTNIEKVIISETVRRIGTKAFTGSSITSVEINPNNNNFAYDQVNHLLTSKEGCIVYEYIPTASPILDVTIKNNISVIAPGAFVGSGVTSITFEDTVAWCKNNDGAQSFTPSDSATNATDLTDPSNDTIEYSKLITTKQGILDELTKAKTNNLPSVVLNIKIDDAIMNTCNYFVTEYKGFIHFNFSPSTFTDVHYKMFSQVTNNYSVELPSTYDTVSFGDFRYPYCKKIIVKSGSLRFSGMTGDYVNKAGDQIKDLIIEFEDDSMPWISNQGDIFYPSLNVSGTDIFQKQFTRCVSLAEANNQLANVSIDTPYNRIPWDTVSVYANIDSQEAFVTLLNNIKKYGEVLKKPAAQKYGYFNIINTNDTNVKLSIPNDQFYCFGYMGGIIIPKNVTSIGTRVFGSAEPNNYLLFQDMTKTWKDSKGKTIDLKTATQDEIKYFFCDYNQSLLSFTVVE